MPLAEISANTDIALGLVLTIVLPLMGWLAAKTKGSTDTTHAIDRVDTMAKANRVRAKDTEARVRDLETDREVREALAKQAEKAAEKALFESSSSGSSTADGERPRR